MSNRNYLEFIMSAFIALVDSHSISKVIGELIVPPLLEFPMSELSSEAGKRRVDLYSRTKSGREVYCEVQISPSDRNHLEQNKSNIDLAQSATLIWIASSFSASCKDELILYAKNSKKDIDIYFLEISPELLEALEIFRYLHTIKVKENLLILKRVERRFLLADKYLSPVSTSYSNLTPLPSPFLSERSIVNFKIISKANHNPNSGNLNFTRYRHNLDKNEISVGGGRDSVYLFFCYLNSKGFTYVGYDFNYKSVSIFYALLDKKSVLESKLGRGLIFDESKKKIFLCIQSNNLSEDSRINWIVYSLEMIENCMSNYIYYLDTDYQDFMFAQNPEGIL